MHTEVYHKFCDLYERKLKDFLDKRGISEKEFEKMCADGIGGPSEEKGGNQEFVELFINSTSFESFVEIMRDVCRRMECFSGGP